MKKLIIFSALALLMQSCIMYTDKDDKENPQKEVLAILHERALNSVLQTIKLADFFDSYQAVRQDRDAALLLGYEYYGDNLLENLLVYENYQGGMNGYIETTPEAGEYIVTPYLIHNSSEIQYRVKVEGDRKYRITAGSPETKDLPYFYNTDVKIVLDCSAYISPEGEMIIESLDMRYIEKNGKQETTAHIRSASETVKAPMADEEYGFKLPTSGVLDYQTESNMFKDNFSVRYTDYKYEIL